MTRPIAHLFALFVVLFAVLVGFTSRWTVFEASGLKDNPLNRRALLEELMIDRGSILASDNSELARSVPAEGKTFRRVYPKGELFAQAVGWSYPARGVPDTGTERYRREELLGNGDVISSTVNRLTGRKRVGNTIRTHLDVAGQQAAFAGLAGRPGSVVALDPRTGAVKVMASVPSFNPPDLEQARKDPAAPLLNRATQSRYPPGSTMKVVTAVAAIDSGKYTPSSVLDGSSPQDFSGVPLNNDAGENFGPVDLTTALTNSVNTVWANVAVSLGRPTMEKYLRRFGFDRLPELDYPADQMVASGAVIDGAVVSPRDDRVDIARAAIGQDKLLVTPLQMAEVAAAVANKGVLMKPRLGDSILDPDGRLIRSIPAQQQSRVMSAKTARQINLMMQQVVREGTGTAAALEGIDVAGKTGTAQIDIARGITQPWFIAFAPARNPRVAIAVTVERTVDGFGGTVAAPIAKSVMEALLRADSSSAGSGQ
ncbi:MAG: penicillin-binding protein 2 [Actinomycetes bacterium]